MQVEARQGATGGSHTARGPSRVCVGLNLLQSSQHHASGSARRRRDVRMVTRLRIPSRRPNIREVAGARGRRLSAQRLTVLRRRQGVAGDLLASPLVLECNAH